MTEEARYSYSSDRNRLLLLALVQAWGDKCYWCRTPKTFRDLEIDHIVPRNPRGGADPDFDVDAAENLAPICGPCNVEKSNKEFDDAPRVDAVRKAAVEAAPKVRRNLARFYKNDAVVKALLAVTAADLANPEVAESIAAFGTAIMPVFRESFPEILTATYTRDFTVRRPPVELHGHTYRLPEEQSFVELDSEGQRALIILEDVMGISMVDAIDDVRRSVGDDINDYVKEWLRRAEMQQYRRTSLYERPSANHIGVYVRELRYSDGDITLTGELDATFSADVEEDDPDPDRGWSTDRRAEFDIAGDFSLTYSDGEVTDAWVVTNEPEENPWRSPTFRYDD